MIRLKPIMTVALISVFVSLSGAVRAQTNNPYRLSDREVEKTIRRVENDAKTFRSSFDRALDRSRLDGTTREDDVNARIKDFEEATKQLHDRFDERRSVANDVQNVLERAARIDEFMRRNRLDRRAQGDWSKLRGDLDRLASIYGVTWRWQQTYQPVNPQVRPYRINDRQADSMLRRTERDANAFRSSLDRALDRSRLDGTAREDNINQFVKEFDDASQQLRERFDGRTSVAADVELLLTRAGRIDNFMRRHRLDRRVQRDWTRLKSGLNQLARAYNVAGNWSNVTY